MLRVLLFAFLVNGSMGLFPSYDPSYMNYLKSFESTRHEKFPTLKYKSNENFRFDLKMKRNGNALVFETQYDIRHPSARNEVYMKTDGNVSLVFNSIEFEFQMEYGSGRCFLHIEVQTENPDKAWRVTSPVYTVDNAPKSAKDDARKNAVYGWKGFTFDTLDRMGYNEFENLNLLWAVRLLQKGALCPTSDYGTSSKRECTGYPFVMYDQALEVLNTIRERM